MKKNAAGKGLVPAAIPDLTIGLDVGDRISKLCAIDGSGEVVERSAVNTTRDAWTKRFGGMKCAQIVLEVGTHSPWMSRLLSELGHQVIVANARKVGLISQSDFKTDKIDAAILARLGRVDPKLLSPITHRGRESQIHLVTIRACDTMARGRPRLIACVRSTIKSMGYRLPKGWPARDCGSAFECDVAESDSDDSAESKSCLANGLAPTVFDCSSSLQSS